MKNQYTTRTALGKLRNAIQFVRGGGQAIVLASLLITTAAKAQPFVTPGDEFLILCEHASTTIQLINTDPGMNVDLISTSGVTSPGFTYDPGTGELIITGLTITGPKSYGQYNFEMQPSNDRFTIYIIECCQEIDFQYIIVEDATSVIGTSFSGDNILVLNELFIDANTTFSGCNVYFGADARIRIDDGQLTEFYTSSLEPFCEYLWDGVFANDVPTAIIFDGSSIEGSARGFNLSEDVDFYSESSTYLNNLIGIGLFDCTDNGSYLNDSYVLLDDNTFRTDALPLPFASGSTIDMSGYAHLNPTLLAGEDGVHIYLQDGFAQLGDPNLGENDFSSTSVDDVVGIFTTNATCGAANNRFTNLRFAIYSEDSKLDLGGSTTAWANHFLTTGYFSTNTSQHLQRNTFYRTFSDIEIPSNQSIAGITGTRLYTNNYDSSNTHITGNNSVVNVVIENNATFLSTMQVVDVATTSISAGLKIIGNTFNRHISTNSYCLKLINTPEARVGDNDFDIDPGYIGAPPVAIPVIDNHGLYLEDVEDAQIKGNWFNERDIAIYGTGDLTGTIFSCNDFDENLVGLFFENATVSDQGSSTAGVDNTWIDFNVCGSCIEARIYVDNTSFDYYHTSGSSKDPTAGIGVVSVGGGSVSTPAVASSTISSCGVVNKTVMSPYSDYFEFIAFPNPASTYLTISITEHDFKNRQFELIDVLGQIVYRTEIISQISELQFNLNPGVYYGRLKGQEDEHLIRVVIR